MTPRHLPPASGYSSSRRLRIILGLAAPVFAEEMLNLMVSYTDWWLASRFLAGPQYKAAMALMAYMMWLIPSLFSAVAIGATAMTARMVGAGDSRWASRVTCQAMILGVLLAVAATIAMGWGGPAFIQFMQLPKEPAELAWIYLRIIIPVIPLIMVEQVASACLRGAGDTVSGFVAKSIVNVTNIVLSASLMLGWGPFPRLGWVGLAIGTAVGHGLGGLILLLLLMRGRAGLRLRLQWLRPHADTLRRLLRVGGPGGIDVLVVIACHFIYVRIINSLGTDAAAAHGLGVQIEALSYLPGSAFQVAAATITGQLLGAKNPREASRSIRSICWLGGGFMIACGFAFYFAGPWLTAFFTGDIHNPTAVEAASLLKIVALSMPSFALTTILTGALRGAGDTFWPLVYSLIGFLAVRIPGACLLAWDTIALPGTDLVIPGLGMGVAGAWWAMVADVVVRSVLIGARYRHGHWKRIRV